MKKYLVSICLLALSIGNVSFAGLNLIGGVSSYGTQVQMPAAPSILLGGELTLNFLKIVELGVFYDHNIANSSVGLAGLTTRLGFGPLFGLFLDAKVGVVTTSLGIGAGVGLGYRINDTLGVRVGPRLISDSNGPNVIGDLGLMIYL